MNAIRKPITPIQVDRVFKNLGLRHAKYSDVLVCRATREKIVFRVLAGAYKVVAVRSGLFRFRKRAIIEIESFALLLTWLVTL